MSNKKNGPTHSQTLGIIWLSVAFVLILVVAFFSKKITSTTDTTDTTEVVQREILTQKEDSAYRTRHPKTTFRGNRKTEFGGQRTETSKISTSNHQPPAKHPLIVEINSADTLTLQLLHGIGPIRARRIVGYREQLGGFTSTDQLLEVYGLTPELLANIRPYLQIDSSTIRRIDINTVPLKKLSRHPYMDYYQARDIVRLRSMGTVFHCADDLRAVPSMTDSTLERLLPYIAFTEDTLHNK